MHLFKKLMIISALCAGLIMAVAAPASAKYTPPRPRLTQAPLVGDATKNYFYPEQNDNGPLLISDEQRSFNVTFRPIYWVRPGAIATLQLYAVADGYTCISKTLQSFNEKTLNFLNRPAPMHIGPVDGSGYVGCAGVNRGWNAINVSNAFEPAYNTPGHISFEFGGTVTVLSRETGYGPRLYFYG